MDLRSTGSVLFVSCYELGHQPLAVASPMGFLQRAGFAPDVLDVAVERLDEAKVARAGLVAISVPMHTALRLGVRVAERVRQINPTAHICFYGLYAALNADYLLSQVADSCIGGECEEPLVALAEALSQSTKDEGRSTNEECSGPVRPSSFVLRPSVPGVTSARDRATPAGPHLQRLRFPLPMRDALPPLEQYAKLEHQG